MLQDERFTMNEDAAQPTQPQLDAFRQANLANWQERVGIHAESSDYNLAAYIADPKHLSDVVRYDRARLGDIAGLDVLHLQCHIGTDTLSLARLGARTVTGLDFSPAALATATELAERAGARIAYVQSELYSAPAALQGTRFDLVYTGVGAINWLPDIRAWARVVAACLRPGGRLFMREGHPMMYTLDQSRTDQQLVITQPYFEQTQPQRWEESHTYTEGPALTNRVNFEWSHGLGEIVQAVIDAGLVIARLDEHTQMPWRAFPWMVADGEDWVLASGRERLPLMYTLIATQPA